MQNYKVLGPSEIGKGILIEYDAGYVSPNEFANDRVIKENLNASDYSKPFEFYAVLQKYDTLSHMNYQYTFCFEFNYVDQKAHLSN